MGCERAWYAVRVLTGKAILHLLVAVLAHLAFAILGDDRVWVVQPSQSVQVLHLSTAKRVE